MAHMALIVYLIVGCVLAGVAMVATILAGYTSFPAILEAAVCGYLVAVPAAWMLMERLARGERRAKMRSDR